MIFTINIVNTTDASMFNQLVTFMSTYLQDTIMDWIWIFSFTIKYCHEFSAV